jgi:predicted MPP superfamily phosphohydrolase
VEEARRLGFDVLLNEHRVVRRGAGSLLMAGITDYSGGQFLKSHASDPAKAFAGAPKTDARILLAHQPKSLRSALPHGFDLQISGHTHGGQFFPWNLLAAVDQPYVSGFHRHENSWIYVSRGTGYWGPPVRIAARSEITLFTLTRG